MVIPLIVLPTRLLFNAYIGTNVEIRDNLLENDYGMGQSGIESISVKDFNLAVIPGRNLQ